VKAPGLTPMGRVHLIMGATSYLISAVWAASLAVGVVLALQGQQVIPSYFIDKRTLFPVWPVVDAGAAMRLLFATMTIVLLPKFLGLILEVKRAHRAREPLGVIRAALGVGTEAVFSILMSPILMVTQTAAVFEVLFGRDSGWRAQARGATGMTFAQAAQFHWRHVAIGVLLALLCWWASPQIMAWMSPVIAGLVLSVPLSWYIARPAGPVMRTLLSTPDCRSPPSIIESAKRASGEWQTQVADIAADADVLEELPRSA
jgi:membrane glycosyltransferase